MVRSVSPWLLLAALALAACSRDATAPVLVSGHGPVPPITSNGEPRTPSQKEGLSRQLGGMRLGMTADEFIATCRAAGGTLSRADEINLTCSKAPVPLEASSKSVDLGGKVAGKFCGPGVTVCELAYMFDADGDEQTAALVDLLTAKYGAPAASEGHMGSDPMARCQKERSVHFARMWSFGPPHAIGSARLAFACDLRVTAETHKLTLLYDDESGLRHRAREQEHHDSN
jgi:hypothetical protein